MVRRKRKQLMVDPKVQGPLVVRVVLYWMACMLTMEFLKLTWRIATGPEQPSFLAYFLQQNWMAILGQLAISSILLVPLVFDMLNLSNRFAGPVYRIRRVLREVAATGQVEEVRLRQGDYWHGLADELNAALQRLAKDAGKPVAAPPAYPPAKPLEALEALEPLIE